MNAADSKVNCGKFATRPCAMEAALSSLRLRVLKGFLFVLCLGACRTQAALAAGSLLHQQAPEIVRLDLNHKKLDLNSYRGKLVLLNFWATWCAPCQLEMPHFVAWQSRYSPRGLQVIGISMDDDPALVRELCGKLRVNYPVAMGDETIGEAYGGILGLPVTYLIDANGEIRAEYRGEKDLNTIERRMKMLLPRR